MPKRDVIDPEVEAKAKLLINLVADQCCLDRKKFLADIRKDEYKIPRAALYFVLREELGFNWRWIGELFAGRDHSSIFHTKKTFEENLSTKHIATIQAYEIVINLTHEIFKIE